MRTIRIYDGDGPIEKACFLWIGKSFSKQKTSVDELNLQVNTQQQWETKTDDQASVNVVVTPLDLSPQSAEWKFDVGMNTHSVELSQDMTQSVALVGDDGKTYQPTQWEGPADGHHREGILFFSPITPYPQQLTLKISDIGGVPRSFSWVLSE